MLELVRHVATITRIDAHQSLSIVRHQLFLDGQAGTDDLDPAFLKLEANTWRLVMLLYRSVLSFQILKNDAQAQTIYFVCVLLNFRCGLIGRLVGTSHDLYLMTS